MKYFSQKLIKDEELEKKIKFICSYNNSKCEFIDERIINDKLKCDSCYKFNEIWKLVTKVN